MKLSYILFITFLFTTITFSQTGPGGIDDTDGSSDLVLWLDANAIVDKTDGANISTWSDQSGYSNDVSQVDVSKMPVYNTVILNGLPVLTFDGSDFLERTYDADLNTSEFAVYCVAITTGGTGAYRSIIDNRYDDETNKSGYNYYATDDNKWAFWHGDGTGGNWQAITGSSGISGWTSLCGMHDGSRSYFYENGDGKGGASNSYGNATSTNIFTIGAMHNYTNDSEGAWFTGQIAEVIVFKKALPLAERTIVDNYIAAKYGLSTNADRYAGDTDGDYDYNAAGIGRESTSTQSSSNSAGLIITNDGYLDSDGDYLMYGHKVTSNSTVAVTATNAENRWDRAWYIDKTDGGGSADGNIDIAFDFGDGGFVDAPVGIYYLLKSTNDGTNWTEVMSSITIQNSDQVLFSSVNTNNFNDGDIITIGNPASYTPAGSGTQGDPYQIATLNNLFWIYQNESEWGNYFTQTADIDASSTTDWDEGKGWLPIGYYNGSSYVGFNGNYDGQNYSIQNLFINRTSSSIYEGSFIGFFGVTEGAAIANLNITTCNITGYTEVGSVIGKSLSSTIITNSSSSGSVSANHSRVGGLVGLQSGGSITESSSSCTVTGSTGGGLIGLNDASASISACYTTGNVSGNSVIGGLVGENKAAISQCFAEGDATATDQYVGGLVGTNKGVISKSYSTGSATGQRDVGGFIGQNYSNSADIDDCYSRGNVTRSSGSSTDLGGFVGVSLNGTPAIDNCYSTGTVSYGGFSGALTNGSINNSFWDIGTSGQSSSDGGTGKTTNEMKLAFTFTDAGWSSDTWKIDSGTNDGYPYLDWESGGGTPLPVELISFTASQIDEGILLEWETATEVNNYGFEIERSLVISNEERNLEWEKIGFVTGHGNGNSPRSYSYLDQDYDKDQELRLKYRLKQIDTDGSFTYYSTIAEVDYSVTSVNDDELATEYSLSQNYPNPFNPVTIIKYTIPVSEFGGQTSEQVSLRIYDILGNDVTTLVNETKVSGVYEVKFDARNLSSGLYFYKLWTGSFTSIKKMILLK
jgi:hypothetical protein